MIAGITMNSKRIAGVMISVLIFVVWVLVDMAYFPSVTGQLGYPMFEVVAYGSWFIIVLIILGVLSWSGNIPTRYSSER